jgi:hypothetical protein
MDFTILREEAQTKKNKKVEILLAKGDLTVYKYINKKELDKVLNETSLSFTELIKEVKKNKFLLKVLSGRITKKVTKQNFDEKFQFKMCKKFEEYGIYIEKLPIKIGAKYLNKEGNITTKKCSKSLDGKISGKINGWIFMKSVFGQGGHQDNVFIEINEFCKKLNKNINEFFVLLVDTNLYKKLNKIKETYKNTKNLLVVNSLEFQKYIADNFKC